MRLSRNLQWVVSIGPFLVTSMARADNFNYRGTRGDNYGPEDWDRVKCSDLDDCDGWPDKHLASIGWELNENMCVDCAVTGNNCEFNHRMSPVDLQRDRAIEDHPNWKECIDWHWMNFEDGTCTWNDVQNDFKIQPHALQLLTPMRNNGDINCVNSNGDRKYPRLDYSKGFPDWWHLDRTEIKVPSEHTQQGKRYAAEVVLSHFYELDHWKNQIGYVSLFMEDYPGQQPWHYLDKLICAWRKEEEEIRSDCGLPPAPVYKMCELYRGQTRSFEDFEFFEAEGPIDSIPDTGQLDRPDPIPIENFGGNPDATRFPLQLCQGDCDFSEDCAPGLICHRREAFGAVPGCIGGEDDSGSSDYCVFDPFGPGYDGPTAAPTGAPSITARPTLSQLPPLPLVDWSGTPPLSAFPLQRCHGDCDTDDNCAEGLVCYQRNAFEAIPGCLGGESDEKMTDYCILDPFGDGSYVDPAVPTEAPTTAPSDGLSPPPTSTPTSLTPPTAMPTSLDATSSPTSGQTTTPSTVLATSTPTAIAIATSAPTSVIADGTTSSPTVVSTIVQSQNASGPQKEINNRGWEPPFKLDACEGDCDEDSDCLPGLICFEREISNTPVPGCNGGESDFGLTDYCIFPEQPILPDLGGDEVIIGRVDTSSPTTSPVEVTATATNAPTGAPTSATSSPTVSTSIPTGTPIASPATLPVSAAIPLDPVGWSPPDDRKPLGACQGDCDDDSDCQPGLKCFQRFLPGIEVPGCIGGAEDASLMDFCIVDPTSIAVDAPFATLSPTTSPNEFALESRVDTDSPTRISTNLPSANPSKAPLTFPATPPPIDCPALEGQVVNPSTGREVNINRFCDPHPNECCQSPRSDSNYCHEMYDFFGDTITSVCHHCCAESNRQEALPVGPPNTPNDALASYEKCHLLQNSARFCKDNGCCDEGSSGSAYCLEQFELHPGDEERICWYCCHPSKEFFPPNRQRELSEEKAAKIEDIGEVHTALTEEETILMYKNEEARPLGPDDRVFQDSAGRRLIVRAENFEKKKSLEEEAIYFDELHKAFQRRELQESIAENYEDVYWWPYEWLLKVGTEYYFRYEGSMTVPPCYTVNHWRVMKDPIRVASHQIKELERLLAWRLNGNCEASTAGKAREGNPDAVDVNRPLQELERGHRLTFCECQDWPSKFPAEREWCRKWQERDPELRLFQRPYNWAQDGF